MDTYQMKEKTNKKIHKDKNIVSFEKFVDYHIQHLLLF